VRIKNYSTSGLNMSVEEQLASFAADVLSDTDYAAMVHCLFAHEPGRWFPLGDICALDEGTRDRALALEQAVEGRLIVAWMEHPQSVYGDEYVTVHFGADTVDWWTTAVFNKGLFMASDTSEYGDD